MIVKGRRVTERSCNPDAVETGFYCWAEAKVRSKSAKRKTTSGQKSLNDEQVGPYGHFPQAIFAP